MAQSPARLDRHYPDFERDDVEDWPAKYIGYRVFSKWVASDQGFLIVRRFGALNARVILSLQDEIAELEDELNVMDEEYSRKSVPNGINNGSFRLDPIEERKKLVRKDLPEKLERYSVQTIPRRDGMVANFPDRFINEYYKLVDRPAVDKEDVNYVRRYFDNSYPIDDVEAAYIGYDDDLIPVQPKKRSWLRKILEPTLLQRSIVGGFFSRKPREYSVINDGRTIWQNDEKVEGLCTAALAVLGLAMLIGPLWVLEYVGGAHARLGIMTGFIALFFFMVHVATTARVFEVLAATAAYSAVLMVFLQLGTK